jgi:predicted small secreted protein
MIPANPQPARRTILPGVSLVALAVTLAACVTSRVEDVRQNGTGINDGEGVVIMAKSYHLGNETEAGFISCVGDALGRGSSGLRVVPNTEFVDALFPWFEPRTAPAETKGLPDLM